MSFASTVGVSSTHPSDMPADHAALPVWNAENWFYEDFQIGDRIRSLRRTIRRASRCSSTLSCSTCTLTSPTSCSPNMKAFSESGSSPARLCSPPASGCRTNCVNAFSYGYDKLRFIKPVFIGDTIYTIRTHLEKRPKYRDMGLIRASYHVFKSEGELVLYCEHLQTVKYRDAAAFADLFEDQA